MSAPLAVRHFSPLPSISFMSLLIVLVCFNAHRTSYLASVRASSFHHLINCQKLAGHLLAS